MASTKRDFEGSMEKLEKIVSELESGDFSLADSMKKFEEGLKLGSACKEMLDKAEEKVRLLVENDHGDLEEREAGDEL
ncbi:MAG: exodeoxyribonuclease VII small subunit [Candidatus Krumholzibacteriia bacterium]